MAVKLAVVVSHVIPHFAPWHREVARLGAIDIRVFFCCDWGVNAYLDPQFGSTVQWDVPLLDGYEHGFLPIARRPERLGFWEVDNPGVGAALDRFGPDVVQVFGYARRTNWRVAAWTARHGTPLLLYSDSSAARRPAWWKRPVKRVVVGRFYRRVDGALFVGDSNLLYHRHYGLPEERLFPGVLPIDRDRLLAAVPDRVAARRAVRERHGIPEDAFVAMLCGKYTRRKRPLDLVQAVQRAMGPSPPMWALLVGEGPERDTVEAFCRAHGVARAVLTGFVNQSAIAGHYAAADVLVVPSSLDPHPLVVSEAASFGLPVVVSDRVGCIGTHDTARPGVNALVYRCGDVGGLAAALTTLAADAALYRSMSLASEKISRGQDATAAAHALGAAVCRLHDLGPRG
jgi:glycosyltransferase involved in cell wall biosynthesis